MRFDTLDQWLSWQETLHPQEIELGLERVQTVWKRLKPDGLESPVITVAGTNGKGSCVAMLASIYRQAGFKVGVYSSPHLVRYNERIRLDGEEVDDARLCQVFDAIDKARGDKTLTYFEFGTLAALSIFAEEKPDLVILEVGLGGRLDAVNIIDADLAMITTIALDHTDWLGETREEIGREKAGIMRKGRPVVLADPNMPTSVYSVAEEKGAKIFAQGRDFSYAESASSWTWSGPNGQTADFPLPALQGEEQLFNASAVVMACHCLKSLFEISNQALALGLTEVKLGGRQQYFPGEPDILLDVAHNPQAVESLKKHLSDRPGKGKIRAVFGLLKGKDEAAIISIMQDVVAEWHLTDLPSNRGQKGMELAAAFKNAGSKAPISVYSRIADAFEGARASSEADDLVLVFGSFLLVGEIMQILRIE
jgi:dihydrofolate synthase/folylpolyglutamate synthase